MCTYRWYEPIFLVMVVANIDSHPSCRSHLLTMLNCTIVYYVCMYWKSLSRSHAKSCQKTTATVAHCGSFWIQKVQKNFFIFFKLESVKSFLVNYLKMKAIRFQRAWWNYQFFCNFLVQDDPLYRSSSRMRSIRYKL